MPDHDIFFNPNENWQDQWQQHHSVQGEVFPFVIVMSTLAVFIQKFQIIKADQQHYQNKVTTLLTITIEIDYGIEKNQQKFPINPALLICQFLQLERHSVGTTKLQRSHNHPIIRLSIACHKSWQISTMQFTLLQCGKRKTIWS